MDVRGLRVVGKRPRGCREVVGIPKRPLRSAAWAPGKALPDDKYQMILGCYFAATKNLIARPVRLPPFSTCSYRWCLLRRVGVPPIRFRGRGGGCWRALSQTGLIQQRHHAQRCHEEKAECQGPNFTSECSVHGALDQSAARAGGYDSAMARSTPALGSSTHG